MNDFGRFHCGRLQWAILLLIYALCGVTTLGCDAGTAVDQPAKRSDSKWLRDQGKLTQQEIIATALEITSGCVPTDVQVLEMSRWLDGGADLAKLPSVFGNTACQAEKVITLEDIWAKGTVALIQSEKCSLCAVIGCGNGKVSALSECAVLEPNRSIQWIQSHDLKSRCEGQNLNILSLKSKDDVARVWMPYKTIELGDISDEAVQTMTFLVNVSNRPIAIKSGDFSCSCGTISFESTTIPADGIVRAKIDIDTTGKKEGPLHLSLIVKTEPSLKESAFVRIDGNIVHATHFDPPEIPVGTIAKGGAPFDVESTIRHSPQIDVQSAVPVFLPDGIKWKTAVRMNDHEIRVVLRITPGLLDLGSTMYGDLDLTAVVGLQVASSSSNQLSPLALSVRGRRVRDVQFYPTEVYLSNCQPGHKYTRQVTIANTRNVENSQIRAVAQNPASINPVVDGRTVNIEIKSPNREGLFRDLVFLQVGDQFAFVPIVGVVRRDDDEAALTIPNAK